MLRARARRNGAATHLVIWFAAMSNSVPQITIDLDLAQRIENHCVDAWPAQEVERWSDGWVMRATPGLPGRGRSNHALVPVRPIPLFEYEHVFSRVSEFSARHGIQGGMQVGPIDLHLGLLGELQVRDWEIQQSVCVMTGYVGLIGADADPEFELTVTDHPTDAWMDAWAACEPDRRDRREHRSTVFRYLGTRGRFFHHGDSAVGLSVEQDGLVGLFCLAVRPGQRRQGLGKKLVRGMLASAKASDIAYLQVYSSNVPGLALYQSLGFSESYRYCHCVAPEEQDLSTATDAVASGEGDLQAHQEANLVSGGASASAADAAADEPASA